MRVKRGRKSSTDKRSGKKRKVSVNKRIGKAKAAISRDIITDQFDKRVDYVHVKKRVNKAPIIFKKKVLGALATQVPYVTKIYTVASASVTTTTATEQCWQILHLKPWAGQSAVPGAGTLFNEPAQNDLSDLSGDLNTSAIGDAPQTTMSSNFWIKQAWLEAYVENTGSVDGLLQVYELDYVPRAGNPINQYASFNAALTAAIASMEGYGTAYSLTDKGVTPFDITELLRTYGIRIIKKMSTDLQANGRFTYIMKDYRKHYVNAIAIQKDLGSKFCIQNMTKSLLFICKPYNDATATFRVSADKHYRIQPASDTQELSIGGRD